MKRLNKVILFFIFIISFNPYIKSKDTDLKKEENRFTIYIKSLEQILKENPSITCLKCFGKISYDFPPFLEPTYPNKGTFDECFILSIPQGKVQGFSGNVVINNSIIQEMIWARNMSSLSDLMIVPDEHTVKLPGRVAVITQNAAYNYCHFLHEVLGRLALLEMHAIEYDYIVVPYHKPFMQELLSLWGVDTNKIVYINDNYVSIQADELIVPSLVLNTNVGFTHAGFHPHPKTSLYVKEKLSKAIDKLHLDASQFSKKVFISRKDAPKRKIINEDDVFAVFEPYGFVRYEMSKLSVLDQILIMQNADIIVGEHGAGLTNILFAKEKTLVFELFQELIDSSDWWVANLADLRYVPINTLGKDTTWAANWKIYGDKYSQAWAAQTVVDLDKIQEVIKKYLN